MTAGVSRARAELASVEEVQAIATPAANVLSDADAQHMIDEARNAARFYAIGSD